jgi:hypothetical protein
VVFMRAKEHPRGGKVNRRRRMIPAHCGIARITGSAVWASGFCPVP